MGTASAPPRKESPPGEDKPGAAGPRGARDADARSAHVTGVGSVTPSQLSTEQALAWELLVPH